MGQEIEGEGFVVGRLHRSDGEDVAVYGDNIYWSSFAGYGVNLARTAAQNMNLALRAIITLPLPSHQYLG